MAELPDPSSSAPSQCLRCAVAFPSNTGLVCSEPFERTWSRGDEEVLEYRFYWECVQGDEALRSLGERASRNEDCPHVVEDGDEADLYWFFVTGRGGAEHVSWVCDECLEATGPVTNWAVRAARDGRPEGPTRRELVAFALGLPPDEGLKLLASARPRGKPEDIPVSGTATAPVYRSWEDYLSKTTPAERLTWCAVKAAKANGKRLMSPAPTRHVTAAEVLVVLEAAKGHCCYCGSLAVEKRPSGPRGGPLPWADVGRRIGSLGHRLARFHGGGNDIENLSWVCLWCNTWPEERPPGASDHGALQDGPGAPSAAPGPSPGGGS